MSKQIIGLKDLLRLTEDAINWVAPGYNINDIFIIKKEIVKVFKSDSRCEQINNEYHCIFVDTKERKELLESILIQSSTLKVFADKMVKGGLCSYHLKNNEGLPDDVYGTKLLAALIDDAFEKMG